MNDYWNTGWDPHQALLMCEQNIQQCAIAINQGTEVMKDLANKYNHQQEVIQQLMFQNQKLARLIEQQRLQINNHETALAQIRASLPQ